MAGIITNYLLLRITRQQPILAVSSLLNALNLVPKRRLTTQQTSSTSTSTSKYDIFFPSFYREHVSDLIDWYTSIEKYVEPLPASYTDAPYYKPLHELPMTCPDFEDKPHYTNLDDFNDPILIKKGHHFDVISLLSFQTDDLVRIGSNELVKANDLMGKYVLLVCAFVPSLWIGSYLLRDLSLLSKEMYRLPLGRNSFEIVIVPMMRQKWVSDKGVFNHFFSAFPGCLTLPFTHKYRGDFICRSLEFDGLPKCVFVDPSHKVVQVDIRRMVDYGARGFPFSDKHFASLCYDDKWTEPCSPSNKSLAGLLGCESSPSSLILQKLDSEETISVEQLNKHHVGLYLFTRGYMLKDVKNIFQQCRDQGLDLEIVLVYSPFSSIDPEAYQDIVHCVLRKHQVSNWWLYPFNNSGCRRLDKLRERPGSDDSLFIVGPHDEFVDRQAAELLHNFGVHFGTQAYPFTMEALIRAFLQRLGTVTLESFLTYDYVYRDYECDDGKRIPVSELKGKDILVYVEDTSFFFDSEWEKECKSIIEWYNIIKEKDPNFDAIFVPISNPEYSKDDTSEFRRCLFESKTRWMICPFDDPKQTEYLMNHDAFLLTKGLYRANKGLHKSSVLAFGKDGHLHSLQAITLLGVYGLDTAYPFQPESRVQNLREEVTRELLHEFELYDDTTVRL